MNLENCFTASMTAHSVSILIHSNCSNSKLSRKQARRHALHSSMRYQLHSEGRAKCATVLQCRELVTGARAAGENSK